MISKRRIKNILTRFLQGDEYYTNHSPRISRKEVNELWDLGFDLQIEHTYGASAGPIAVYPLHPKEFEKKAREWLKKEAE